MPQATIALQPVGDDVPVALLRHLRSVLSRTFDLPCRIAAGHEIPRHAYDPRRRQYDAETVLESLAPPRRQEARLSVVAADCFAGPLNFVFGLAHASEKSALIALARIAPDLPAHAYGERLDEIFRERAVKEAVHELGHVFGLTHCPRQRCVMYFSNMLDDTDAKSATFCARHAAELQRRLGRADDRTRRPATKWRATIRAPTPST